MELYITHTRLFETEQEQGGLNLGLWTYVNTLASSSSLIPGVIGLIQ